MTDYTKPIPTAKYKSKVFTPEQVKERYDKMPEFLKATMTIKDYITRNYIRMSGLFYER